MGTTGDIGSAFDDFLEEEGLLESCEAAAEKKVPSYRIRAPVKERRLSKSAMARLMGTSRSSLERLLDSADRRSCSYPPVRASERIGAVVAPASSARRTVLAARR